MSCSLLLGVMVLAAGGLITISSNHLCEPKTTTKLLQTSCRRENEALDYANINQNHTDLCMNYELLLKCAVTAIPSCYDFIDDSFLMYRHSPFSCQMSEALVMELQEIVKKGAHVATTEASPTTSLSSVILPATTETGNDEKEEPEISDKKGANKGSIEEHKGVNSDNHSHVAGWSLSLVMLCVMISTKQIPALLS